MRFKLVSITAALMFFSMFQIVNAETENLSTTVVGTPTVAYIGGESTTNNQEIELEFDLSILPKYSRVTSVILGYTQENSSTGFIKISDSYSKSLIESMSLSESGNLSSTKFTDVFQGWMDSPYTSQALTFVAESIGTNDTVKIADVKFEITYVIEDKDPPVILDVSIDEVDSNKVIISWAANEEVVGYVRYGKTSSYTNSTSKSLHFEESSIVEITELTQGITYHFKLEIFDKANNKASSQDYIFTTLINVGEVLGENTSIVDSTILNPIRLLNLEFDLKATRVDLAWSASETDGIDGYVIYRSEDSPNAYIELEQVSSETLMYSDSSISPDHTYSYYVRVIKGNDISYKSPVEIVSIPFDSGGVLSETIERDPNQYLLISILGIAAIGASFVTCYMVIKKISNKGTGSSSKKRKLVNVLKDPDHYI